MFESVIRLKWRRMVDWSNISFYVVLFPVGIAALVLIALYFGAAEYLKLRGLRFWEGVFGPVSVAKDEKHLTDAAPQLPDPVPDFTGHEDKVQQLVDRLKNQQGAAITAIGGQGGAGKTEMAYYVAKEVRDVYPGGQVQLNLRGLDAEPMTPEQAMTNVILALEPGLKPPEQPSQIAGLYHGLLSERNVLILADNAKDSEQVRLLAPKPPSALLVTSRETIQVAGVERVDLEQLDPPDAHTLLRGILEGKAATKDEIERLAEMCGFLPLALRVAGNRLAGSPALSVASYLDHLTNRSNALRFGGQDVMAVLAESVEALERDDEALAGKWRSLAVFPAPFGRPAAEAVGEFEDDELDRLLSRSLVLYGTKEDRFRLHDLMRELAWEGLGATDCFQAGARHSRHYLEVIGRALDTYLRGGEGVLEGLRLFDHERAQIEAGQSWAAEHAGSEDDAAALAQDYPLRAASVLGLRLHPRDRIGWLEASAQAAHRLGNREREGNALGNLGIAYQQLGEPKRAIEYHEQALTFARETGDRRGEVNALGNLGLAYADLEEPKRAIEYYEQAFAIARETGNRRGERRALGNQGLAYADLGEPKRAIEYHEQDLAIARETGDRRGEGMALRNLGLAYGDLGEPQRAIEYCEQHLAIALETGDRRGEGIALWNRALGFDELGRRQEAISGGQAALDIFEQIEDPNAEMVRRQLADWGAAP